MKNTLILLTSLSLAIPALSTAGDVDLGIGESDCSVELNHNTRVGPDFFEVSREDTPQRLRFDQKRPAEVMIDNTALPLNAAQQRQMEVYHAGLYQSGQDLTQITVDAVDIVMEGVGIALTALAGADHKDTVEFRAVADELRKATRERVTAQDGVYALGENWSNDIGSTIEETVERELEPRIEKIAMESAGNIAWHALKAVFTGGASIERDAEAAADAAEEIVEARALQLESRAENLCHNLAVMDTIEVDLQSVTPQLKDFDLISLDASTD
ncbi:DUF2884 family protein [Microbulbifer celer]|uniref:DUF2884 family protein n=1 Tax=Microbulbifer celer TaxID=435905 RepID=A0ABW3U5L7_9GAMM|nr:DUF2884 family protein [Microbulbifer celer]UFN56700.1 YggN family protein [Microbulbifer celer]